MSANKKINMKIIEKENEQFSKKNEISFKDMTITVDAKPSQYKINKLIGEFEVVINEFRARPDIEVENFEAVMNMAVTFLMMKLFTDIPVSKTTDIDTVIDTVEKLTNVGLIEALYNKEGFDNENYQNLSTRIFQTIIDPKRDYYNFSANIVDLCVNAGLIVMNNPIFVEPKISAS